MSVLSPELRAWLRPGLAGGVAAADDAGHPEIVRLWALRALEGADVVEVYVQRAAAHRLVEIIGDGRRAAVNVVEVATYRSRMLKGFCTPLAEVDQAFAEASVAAMGWAFAVVGMGNDIAQRLLSHGGSDEMVGFRVEVDRVFDQSPKRGAGAPL